MGQGGKFGIGGAAEEGHGRGTAEPGGEEVGLGAEGPVEKGAGDFGAPVFGRRGRRWGGGLQDWLGIPGGEEGGPGEGEGALLPGGIMGEAVSALGGGGEAGVGGDEEGALPEAGLVLEDVEGEAAPEGVAGEDAGPVRREGGDLVVEPAGEAVK